MKTEQLRFVVVSDKQVLQRSEHDQGPRIGRTQVIRDNITSNLTTINFWYDINGNIVAIR